MKVRKAIGERTTRTIQSARRRRIPQKLRITLEGEKKKEGRSQGLARRKRAGEEKRKAGMRVGSEKSLNPEGMEVA